MSIFTPELKFNPELLLPPNAGYRVSETASNVFKIVLGGFIVQSDPILTADDEDAVYLLMAADAEVVAEANDQRIRLARRGRDPFPD